MDDTTLEQHEFSEVERFLAARRLRHAIIEHSETYTATAEARIAAVSPRHTAKTVMVRDDAVYVLTVIPASELLDLRKLRRIAGRRSPTSSPSAEATIRKSHRAPAGRGRGEQT